MTEELDAKKRTKNAKIIAITKSIVKAIPNILVLIYAIAIIPLLMDMVPYMRGDEVMENPMTNSQLTAMLTVLVLCATLLYLMKVVKKIGRH